MNIYEIIQILSKLGCTGKFRFDALSDWQLVFNHLEFHKISTSDHNVAYEMAYLQPDTYHDCSMVIYTKEGSPCGILVLHLVSVNGEYGFSVAGYGIEPIQFVVSTQSRERKRISKAVIRAILEFTELNNLNKLKFIGYNSVYSESIDEWHAACVDVASDVKVVYQLEIDLSQSIDAIRSSFRKSYKPLINRAMQLWKAEIIRHSTISIDVWQEFKQLHFFASGARMTRSEESWKEQYKQIRGEKAFLIALRDENQQMVGGGFFQHTRDQGSYAAAAYDRSLFDKPLGHLSQWLAINELKRLGVKSYIIGSRLYKSTHPETVTKELNISHFKSGFTDKTIVKYIFEYKNKNV